MNLENLALELFNAGCIKFGEFTLKSGIKSPIYFDFRILVSHPKLMDLASQVFCDKMRELGAAFTSECTVVCGVPYGAVPLATAISLRSEKPMIMRRKEAKSHGTKNLIEGEYKPGDECLVVEDVITSGSSVIETVQVLREHKIDVKHAFVLLDREQGAVDNIAKVGVTVHSLLKTRDVLGILLNSKKLSRCAYDNTLEFLEANKAIEQVTNENVPTKELDFEQRAKLCKNKIARRLFEIMNVKQSNLCLSADVTSFEKLLQIADQVGPHICVLKTHVDIVNDFDSDKLAQLVELADKHNFLIFEDRKFADIGNTVKSQFAHGVFKISQWAHIVNAHSICGQGCIQGLKEADDFTNRGLLLIGQLSSKGNLIDENYTKETIKLAEENNDFVIGFICQKKLSNNPTMIHMMPGVQFSAAGDNLGQQYTAPETAVVTNQCDIVIVGRGILGADDPAAKALEYKQVAFQAYLSRVKKITQ